MEGEDIEALRKQLLEERQQRQRDQQRVEEALQRAEEARQQAEEARQQAEEALQRAEAAERQRQPTTLAEYLDGCHEFLSTKFVVQPNNTLTSKGSITDPRDKWLPSRLSPWSDFLDQQKDILGKLHSSYPRESRDFESLNFLRGLGARMGKRIVANEKDLEYIQRSIVETPVTAVIDELRSKPRGGGFDIGNGVVFENHPNIASDAADEPRERLMSRTPPPRPDRSFPDLQKLRPDQICVYKFDKHDPDRRRMAFVIEYKAPRKLTLPHLRLGLREMDIHKEVVNRSTIPASTEKVALFQYTSDRLAAAAVVQTFHYMIEGGLEYSYLTTGEAYVFLKIDWSKPDVLYFHLAEPVEEARAHPENARHCSVVSQVLAFTLLALESQSRGQDERSRAIERLPVWKECYESILYSLPRSARKETPPKSGFLPRTYTHVDRSPYLLRRGRLVPSTCRPGLDRDRDMDSPKPSADESRIVDTPTRLGPHTRSRTVAQQRQDLSGPSASGSRTRPFCTQECLLGLARGGLLAKQCPNIAFHRRKSSDFHQGHPITHAMWLTLLREQLARTLDKNIEPLGKQGARGIMFKVTLDGYGYTVLAKGTVPAFVEDLQHEAVVYDKLQPLQGECVPVFLGEVELVRPYYYDFRVRVVHLIFLAWAGEPVDSDGLADDVRQTLSGEFERSLRAIHSMGVLHRDVREANALWSDETGRVMVIDFERAVIVGCPRPSPVVTSPEVKGKRSVGMEMTVSLNRDNVLESMRMEEVLTAKSIFRWPVLR